MEKMVDKFEENLVDILRKTLIMFRIKKQSAMHKRNPSNGSHPMSSPPTSETGDDDNPSLPLPDLLKLVVPET